IAALAALLAETRSGDDADRQPGSASAPPAPPDSPRPSAARLPRQLTSFLGREREVAEVAALIAVSPLVTLAGPGGVGKTRVALAVGAEVDQRVGGGAWLAELAGLADEALVPVAVAAALGVPVGGDPIEALARWLGGRPALLLLDSCEHLVGACAGLVEPLL